MSGSGLGLGILSDNARTLRLWLRGRLKLRGRGRVKGSSRDVSLWERYMCCTWEGCMLPVLLQCMRRGTATDTDTGTGTGTGRNRFKGRVVTRIQVGTGSRVGL